MQFLQFLDMCVKCAILLKSYQLYNKFKFGSSHKTGFVWFWMCLFVDLNFYG